MKRTFPAAALLALLLLSVVTAAQAVNSRGGRKVTEFGDTTYEDARSRLDEFSVALRNERGVKGYVFAYSGQGDLPGESLRHAMRAKNYLVREREHDPNDIVVFDRGRAGICLAVELWLVPTGQKPPTQMQPTSGPRRNTNFTRKFDEYNYPGPPYYEGGWSEAVEDQPARLDGFAAALKEEPGTRGYIIAYTQYNEDPGAVVADGSRRKDVLHDQPDMAKAMLSNEKNYLVRTHGVNAARLVTVEGGYRADRTVELWLVPPGAPPPNATPTTRPPRWRAGGLSRRSGAGGEN